jgi:hypothetical protein
VLRSSMTESQLLAVDGHFEFGTIYFGQVPLYIAAIRRTDRINHVHRTIARAVSKKVAISLVLWFYRSYDSRKATGTIEPKNQRTKEPSIEPIFKNLRA